MATKNFIIKKLSLALIFGVMFFATSSVFAAISYNACYSYGCIFPQNDEQKQEDWFNNTNSALSRCVDACNEHISWWKSSNFSSVWDGSFGIQLLSACLESSVWSDDCYENSLNVGHLQDSLSDIGCLDKQVGVDNAMGWNTLHDIVHCCIWEGESLPKMTTNNPTCEGDKVVTENENWQSCCVDPEEPTTCDNPPVITVAWWSDNYTGTNRKTITVDYSSNTNWDFTFNAPASITVEWGSYTDFLSIDTWLKRIQFNITPDANENLININVPWWVWKVWEDECPEGGKTLTREGTCWNPLILDGGSCCMPRYSRDGCYNNDGLGLVKDEYWWEDFSWLDNELCELFDDWFNNIIEHGFCPWCDKAPNVNSGQNCEQTYWSGRDLSDWWCCEQDCSARVCTDPKEKPEGCACVCDPAEACCWIKLNTVVPFIGDCIEMTTQNSTSWARPDSSSVNQLNAFPFLMMGLSKILVTVILIFSFLVVIFAGLMMVAWVQNEKYYTDWKDMIIKVLGALILLWSSGLILKLINPTFFGG